MNQSRRLLGHGEHMSERRQGRIEAMRGARPVVQDVGNRVQFLLAARRSYLIRLLYKISRSTGEAGLGTARQSRERRRRAISSRLTRATAQKHRNDQLAIEPPRKVQSTLMQSPLPRKIMGRARLSGKVSIMP